VNSGGAHKQAKTLYGTLRSDGAQGPERSGLSKGLLRSRFAKALHFSHKPQAEDVHAKELDAMETALKSLVHGDTMEELQEQLSGQKKLVQRLKGNLQDNQAHMRSVLNELKASRNRLTPLESQIQSIKSELFDKSMTVDSQRIEINYLRSELDSVAQKQQQYSEADKSLTELSNENQTLKNEVQVLRARNSELEALTPAGQDTLNALNADIEILKNTEKENRAEIAFLKSESKTALKREAELVEQLETMQASSSAVGAGPIDTAQIQALNEKLHQATAREAMMEKRLEILRRDLDIVHQTNEMLRGRLTNLKNSELDFDIPAQAIN